MLVKMRNAREGASKSPLPEHVVQSVVQLETLDISRGAREEQSSKCPTITVEQPDHSDYSTTSGDISARIDMNGVIADDADSAHCLYSAVQKGKQLDLTVTAVEASMSIEDGAIHCDKNNYTLEEDEFAPPVPPYTPERNMINRRNEEDERI